MSASMVLVVFLDIIFYTCIITHVILMNSSIVLYYITKVYLDYLIHTFNTSIRCTKGCNDV